MHFNNCICKSSTPMGLCFYININQISKSFGALFCAPTILLFWVEKGGGGGWPNPKVVGHFFPNFRWNMTKKCSKSLRVKIAYGKVPTKFKSSWGEGGGSDPVWKTPKLKLHFFLAFLTRQPRSSFIWPCKRWTIARFGITHFVKPNTHVSGHPGV